MSITTVLSGVTAQTVEAEVETTVEVEEKQDIKDDAVILTVDDAVEYSNKNSLTLKSSEIDLELAKWKKNVAWNTFLPNVQLSGTMARANDIKPYSGESLHWSGVGNLSMTFNFNAAMIFTMSATIAEYESGKLTWEQAVRENAINVRKLFYALLLLLFLIQQ